jgi:hypothetical protein
MISKKKPSQIIQNERKSALASSSLYSSFRRTLHNEESQPYTNDKDVHAMKYDQDKYTWM